MNTVFVCLLALCLIGLTQAWWKELPCKKCKNGRRGGLSVRYGGGDYEGGGYEEGDYSGGSYDEGVYGGGEKKYGGDMIGGYGGGGDLEEEVSEAKVTAEEVTEVEKKKLYGGGW